MRHKSLLLCIQVKNKRLCQRRGVNILAEERGNHLAGWHAPTVSQETTTETLACFAVERIFSKVLLPNPGRNASRQQIRIVFATIAHQMAEPVLPSLSQRK